jgi:hypothetical protein
MKNGPGVRAMLALLAACACAGAHAAGGHFAVDDASLLEPGHCEEETWFSRYQEGGRLLHAGVNCRVGPVELDGAGELTHAEGASATQWNLEVKWAHELDELDEQWSIGADLQPFWGAHQDPKYAGTRFNAIVTWHPAQRLALNFNAGHDWLTRARDLPRGGVSVEWQALDAWTLVLERYLETDTHYVRAGAHWEIGGRWSLDLSRAQRLSGPAPSYWTLGVTIPIRGD